MIVLDECKLRYSTIAMIGEDCGVEAYDMREFTEESYRDYIENIIDKFFFDSDEIKERFIDILKDLKIE